MISPEMQAKVARIQELYEEATKDKEAYFQWRLAQRAAYDRDMIRAAYEQRGEARGLKYGEARGIEKGRAEGLKEGEAIGIKKGEARGLKKGRAEGVARALRNAVSGLAKAGHSIESIAEMLKLGVEEISKYL